METTNFGNFDTLKLMGYQYSNKILFITTRILTFGLIKYIPKKIQILLFYKKSLLSKSTHIFIKGFNNFNEIIKIETNEIPIIKENDNIINQFGNIVRFFEIFRTRFIYNRIQDKFMRPIYPEHEIKQKKEYYMNFLNNSSLIEIKEESEFIKKLYFGENNTDLLLPSVIEVFITTLFTLENLYLTIVLIIWYFTDYKIYGLILFIITIFTLSVDIYKKIKSNKKISNQTKKTSNFLINKLLIINNKIIKKEIDTKYLFPGDLIELRDCEKFCCDAIIIKGSLLVDESFLTGESIPIPKEINDIIFSGTKLSNTFQEDNKCIAMVIKTGFNTSHGSLLKTILFPKKSNTDIYRHMGIILKLCFSILFFMFIFMCIYYILIKKNIIKLHIIRVFNNEEKKYRLFLNLKGFQPYILSFDLVTVLMSPAFSAALKLGLMNSISRLKKSNIDCMSISAIDDVGLIDIAVFDKTGTLTESYMELYDTVSITNYKIIEIAKASCHNLQLLKKDNLEELVGDPMDISMVKSTKTDFFNTNKINLYFNNKNINIEIEKRIPFSSERKRITVLVKYESNNKLLITKGSPETIEKLLKEVPLNYKNELNEFSLRGYRVLSVAYKECKGDINETEMKFLGFILFSNPLKNETYKTIEALKNAEIPTIICTGDSILTALSIARELKIVDNVVMPVINTNFKEREGEEIIKIKKNIKNEKLNKSKILLGNKILKTIHTSVIEEENEIKITANDTTSPLRWICTNVNESELEYIPIAIEGPCLNYLRENESELYKQILKRCIIYARMNPEQKMNLVNDLMQLEKEYFFNKPPPINKINQIKIEDNIFKDPYENKDDIIKDKLKVLYCGDGANDCGALNASSIGISLSPHISICHFISRTGNISNVKTIIGEGRSALVTNMSAFRNVCETSILSYIVLTILMFSGSFLSEYETMFHDLCLILPLNIILSTFKPLNKLWNINKYKNNLITLNRFLFIEILNSLKFILLGGFSAVFILTYFYFIPERCSCYYYSKFEDIKIESPLMFHTKKSTIFFYILSLQILLSCIYNCRGKPHRITKYKNPLFICYVIFNSLILLFFITLAFGFFPYLAKKLFICKLNEKEILFLVFLMFFNVFIYMFLHKREYNNKLNNK